VLDPGTQYAIQAILDLDEPAPDRVFNVMLYRLVGRAATHAHVGFQRLAEFDVDAFESALVARRDGDGDGPGEPVFTGAYLVAGYAGYGSSDKVENVARLFGDVRDRFDGFWADVEAASGPEDVYAAICGLPGFGNFLAYQVLVDLLYPLPAHGGESLLPYSPNEWAAAGPGAKEGLGVLVGERVDGAAAGGASADGAAADREAADGPVADVTDLEAMRWLRGNLGAEFDRLGVDFVWLRDVDGERIEPSLADVQNCCCEFYKYERVRTGEGRTRRRFRPGDRRSAGELRDVYAAYPISVEARDYTGNSE
jgi:hypothetical protein